MALLRPKTSFLIPCEDKTAKKTGECGEWPRLFGFHMLERQL